MRKGIFQLVDPWVTFEKRILEITHIALNIIHLRRSSLPSGEDPLNRILYQTIVSEAINIYEEKYEIIVSDRPILDSASPPDPADPSPTPRESKRPDLQWSFRDTSQRTQSNFITYTVECKRLGAPTSPKWILNTNYVENGILRFVNPEWMYGYECGSGLMIGYVQDMPPESILLEVNEAALHHGITSLDHLRSSWFEDGISLLRQTLVRPDVTPESFQLDHLWVDIRTDTLIG